MTCIFIYLSVSVYISMKLYNYNSMTYFIHIHINVCILYMIIYMSMEEMQCFPCRCLTTAQTLASSYTLSRGVARIFSRGGQNPRRGAPFYVGA